MSQSIHSNYFCKDCKHSMVSLGARIGSIIFDLGKVPNHDYKCKLSNQEKSVDYNLVTGPKKIEAYYENCSSWRSPFNDRCGPEGRHWTPKHKKDLFLALTKER